MDNIKAHLVCEHEAHVCAGHPSSVDALVAFDEDTVLTGSQDGLIRVISILPNRMLGVVGEHGEFPVETLALSQDRCVALRRCMRTSFSVMSILPNHLLGVVASMAAPQ